MGLVIVVVLFLVVSIPQVDQKFILYSHLNNLEQETDTVLVVKTADFKFSVEDSSFVISNDDGKLSLVPLEGESFSQLDMLLENWTSTEENVYSYPDGCDYLQLRIHDLVSKVSSYKCLSELPNYEI